MLTLKDTAHGLAYTLDDPIVGGIGFTVHLVEVGKELRLIRPWCENRHDTLARKHVYSVRLLDALGCHD